jgi:CRP/FNR family transcriptional regulator, cyclic AMP receptor protein
MEATVSSAQNVGRERSSTEMLALLRGHPIFGGLERAQLERLVSYARTRKVPSGTTIFVKGDPGNSLFAICAGTVKVAVTAPDGREAMLSLLHSGEIFGEMALLDGRPRAADVATTADCDLMVIERRDFLTFVHSEPNIALKFVELLCERLRAANEQFEEVIFLSLPVRLARTLLRLSQADGATPDQFRMQITQREISHMLGSTRESVNKQLRAWSETRMIALERGGILVLDRDKLVAVAGGASDDRRLRPAKKAPARKPYTASKAV